MLLVLLSFFQRKEDQYEGLIVKVMQNPLNQHG